MPNACLSSYKLRRWASRLFVERVKWRCKNKSNKNKEKPKNKNKSERYVCKKNKKKLQRSALVQLTLPPTSDLRLATHVALINI